MNVALRSVAVVLLTYFVSNGLLAQTSSENSSTGIVDEILVEYPSSFFRRYQPATALDMVRQVPGFQPDDGTSNRGFVSALGNILINDVYPSAKEDTPSAILARIPANQVEKLELIRGQVRGIDLQGQSVVVNVILHEDQPVLIRWGAFVRQHSEGPLKPGFDISLSDRLANIDYNAGVRIEREANGETGFDQFLTAQGSVTEELDVKQKSTGIDLTGTFNGSTLIGQTLVQFNTRAHYETRDRQETSQITPFLPGDEPSERFVGNDLTIETYEAGADALRNFNSELVGKAIFLFFRGYRPNFSRRIISDDSGNVVSDRIADIGNVSTEVILRTELDWTGIDNHNIQFNIEGAYNSVDGSLEQTVDTGSGPVVQDVPGSNSLVEELRGDFEVKDIWTFGNFELDYGLGAEVSRISQSGDAEQERDFVFIKPHSVLAYSPRRGQQTRFRAAREVSQLDFDDFISATVFEDNDLALGNPDLRPETTWITELSHERRFGRESVIKGSVFHHWISNVLDLLPLSDNFEAPGNIGKGRRWGLELESTIPLEFLGLSGAKLDFSALIQDSKVTDPVTGEVRRLSGQGGANAYRTLQGANGNIAYHLRMDYRQDFEEARVAWGWTVAERGRRPLFKVNELDVRNEKFAIDAFVETTRWWGVKISVIGDNLLNFTSYRERTFYTELRDLSLIDSSEIRQRLNGRRITLTLSGNF
jgi:hypothetical protein